MVKSNMVSEHEKGVREVGQQFEQGPGSQEAIPKSNSEFNSGGS
jgi:hypothetical protein